MRSRVPFRSIQPKRSAGLARRNRIFYNPKLGYWVVSRHENVKAVFRDSKTFQPSNALEKVTHFAPEANAVLDSYDYALDCTLVNEDEPAHMERRRALLQSFLPDELAHHEPMVRRLAREYVDCFIDKGEADLVEEMLWEIPLTVALHFLGVPDEDMATLRKYSIAHTVNTWGRPTHDEQLAVAEAVGKFWQYAGRVLEKMRADPSGHGWMEYAIRRQRKLPDIITDSYLHSMMMAGIVAAHETTANAAANALRLLLANRAVWAETCADPALIPNAVEECLRLSGSIVAWRRMALAGTRIGDAEIPKGDKLLIVMASASHDERQFENPDVLDIYRDNFSDHLSFGYGSHQCMVKNLARMEMRIFLEEFTRRLPHMKLVPDQVFTYLPNTSFRGPDHLLVRWDPANNPKRRIAGLRDQHTGFAIGAPARHQIARRVRVADIHPEAKGVVRLTLEGPHGRDLPGWTAGAHVDLIVGDYVRMYSLCGDMSEPHRLQLAVRKEAAGRGGSAYIHAVVTPGAILKMRGPKNHFRLEECAERYLLLAGSIGITPILARADRLKRIGKAYAIHYAGRSRASTAFIDRLRRDHGDHLQLYPSIDGSRLDIGAVIAAGPADALIYACGPERLLNALPEHTGDQPNRLHVEHFSSMETQLDPTVESAFEAELRDIGLSVHVRANQTLLHAVRAVGVDVPSDCEEGLCGSCEVAVLDGEVDHRDRVLCASERAENTKLIACCSRARNGKLVLAL